MNKNERLIRIYCVYFETIQFLIVNVDGLNAKTSITISLNTEMMRVKVFV